MSQEKIEMSRLNSKSANDEVKKFVVFVFLFTIGQIAVSGLFSLNTFVISRGDSLFYLSASTRITDLTAFEQLYSGYIYLLHLSQFFSESGIFMVLIQSLFVLFAGYALFSISEELGGSKAAWFAVTFYFLLPMLTQWTRYILTESIFYALIIIGLRLATLRHDDQKTFLIVPVIVLVIFLRPNGIVIACALATILVIAKFRSILFSTLLVILIWSIGFTFGLTLLSSNHVGQGTVQSSIFEKTLEGDVVFGVAETRHKMPPPLNSDRSNGAFIKYISENPGDNIQLGALRLFWEFKQVRPWYSTSLNVFISFVMFGFYTFCLIGMIKVRNKAIVRATVILTLPSALLIAGTWAIWEGRFAWWILICWIPIFGVGLSHASDFVLRRFR
jgi:hypothetical protein